MKMKRGMTTEDLLKRGITTEDYLYNKLNSKIGQTMKKFSFEKKVIDPILLAIKKHSAYLQEPKNLPQLAKLGYMYEILYSSGRICWGYEGKISKSDNDCENNPKYKLEMVCENNEDIPDLIYDAWGLHVKNDMDELPFEKFRKLIIEGKELSEFQKRMLKKNKTFEEWVDVLTDPEYSYQYENKRGVANHLLCVIGNGYGMNKDGYVIEEAGGADQDKSAYGDWKNAKFCPEIQTVVDKILAMPEVKQTLDTTCKFMCEIHKAEKQKENKQNKIMFGPILKAGLASSKKELENMKWKDLYKLFNKAMKPLLTQTSTKNSVTNILNDICDEEKYHPYYPICNYSVIDIMINPNSLQRLKIKKVHQSYIDAGIEICKEILEHEAEEKKEGNGNVEFAKKFLAKVGFKEYEQFVPKEIDKDKLLKNIQDTFLIFTKDFPEQKQFNCQNEGWTLYLNDTRTNQYADDNYYFCASFKKPRTDLPLGIANTVEYLKDTAIYANLKSVLEKLKTFEDIKQIDFYYNNTETVQIDITMFANETNEDKIKSETDFINDEFLIGQHQMAKILDKKDLIMVSGKCEPLGSKHPNNISGKEYFSTAGYFNICDLNWNLVLSYHIDSRGFNIFYPDYNNSKENLKKYAIVHQWIQDEWKKCKASDPMYGTYENAPKGHTGKEGKRNLYVFEFMNWLYKNQN